MKIGKLLDGITWICVLAILISFWLPWVTIGRDSQKNPERIRLAQIFKERFKSTPPELTVAGYEIPDVADSENVRLLMVFMQEFTGNKNLDKKSRLVYGIPVIAIICGLLGLLSIRGRMYSILLMIFSGALSMGGFYKLYTADFNSAIVEVTIREGIWLTLFAFFIMFIMGLLKSFLGKSA